MTGVQQTLSASRGSSAPLVYVTAALGGLAAALGHAPFGYWHAAVLGFAALIWAVSRAERPARVAWVAGVAYFGVSLHWIVEPFFVDVDRHGWLAPFALGGMAGGLAIFWFCAGWSTRAMAGPRAMTFAIALAAAEVLRGHLFTGFPWALPGYIWVETPILLSVAWIGSYGLTAVTLVAAALPTTFVRPWLGLLSGLLLLGGLAGGGALSRAQSPGEVQNLGTVRILQPNIAQDRKWDRDLAPDSFREKLDLTRGPVDGPRAHDFAIWPETALVVPLDLAGSALEAIGTAAGTPFITGLNRRDGEDWYNSLVLADADGQVEATADKVHLVPFGEYIPFGLPFLKSLAGTSSDGFSSGSDVHLINTPIGRALPLICYEGIFPGQAFAAGERADYMLILTNDAWFGTFAGPAQHLDIARFRAAEHRLSVVRVANKGYSAIIDPFGRVTRFLPPDEPGAANVDVPAGANSSLYARTGDRPVFVLLFLAILSSVIANLRKRIAHPSALE